MTRLILPSLFCLSSLLCTLAMAQTYDPATTAPPPESEITEKAAPSPSSNSEKSVEISEEPPKAETSPAAATAPVPEPSIPPPPPEPRAANKAAGAIATSNIKPKEDPNGLRSTKTICDLHDQPDGKKISTLRADKRVWTDDYNEQWYKVYRQAGFAFAKKSCF